MCAFAGSGQPTYAADFDLNDIMLFAQRGDGAKRAILAGLIVFGQYDLQSGDRMLVGVDSWRPPLR